METTSETTQTGSISGGDNSTTTTEQVGTGSADTAQASAGVSTPTGDGKVSDRADAGAKEAAAANALTQYNPNFKFKVKDKELEFDEWVKPVIKDKDLEAKVREMYEKAHGLDEVKASRETFKTQAEEWKTKYASVENSIQTLGQYVKKGDFESFFNALNIPNEKILRYAIEKLKEAELPPEQRQALEFQRARERELEQAQLQIQERDQMMADLVRQQTEFEMKQALAQPEVAQVVSQFDARAGKPGAFMTEVIRRGQYYESVHKISPPASQLVSEIIQLIGIQPQVPQAPQAQIQQEQPSQATQQQKPVIPAFSNASGSKSPARRVPKSIDDIRKIRQQSL